MESTNEVVPNVEVSSSAEAEYLADLALRTREALLASSISVLGLKVGAAVDLEQRNVEAVRELVGFTAAGLALIGVRAKSIVNIQEQLTRVGLELRHDDEATLPVEQETFEPIPPPQKPTRQRRSKAEAAGLTEERVREIVREAFAEMFAPGGLGSRVGELERLAAEDLDPKQVMSRLERLEADGGALRLTALFMRIERLEARAQSFEIEANNVRANAGERFNEVRRLNEDYTRCAQRTTFLEQRADRLESLAKEFSDRMITAALAKVFS